MPSGWYGGLVPLPSRSSQRRRPSALLGWSQALTPWRTCYVGYWERPLPWASSIRSSASVGTSIPFELSKVEFSDRDSALRFVRRRGLLGYSGHRDLLGDSFEFIWWHAQTIRRIPGVYDALQSGSAGELTEALDVMAPITNKYGFDLRVGPYISMISVVEYRGGGGSLGASPLGPSNTALNNSLHDKNTALDLISRVLSDNIGQPYAMVHRNGAEYLFDDSAPPIESLARSFIFESLSECAWWHLADFIVDRGRLGRCRGCNSYFRRTDARQEFCPAPDGQTHRRKGIQAQATSLCASNYRMQKWREKVRAKRASGQGRAPAGVP